MSAKSPPVVLKTIFNDISKIREVLDESTKLDKSLESINFKHSADSEEIIEKTKNIVDKLKEKIKSIDNYFYKYNRMWKNKNESCDNSTLESNSSESEDAQSLDTSAVISDSFEMVSEDGNKNCAHKEMLVDANVELDKRKSKNDSITVMNASSKETLSDYNESIIADAVNIDSENSIRKETATTNKCGESEVTDISIDSQNDKNAKNFSNEDVLPDSPTNDEQNADVLSTNVESLETQQKQTAQEEDPIVDGDSNKNTDVVATTVEENIDVVATTVEENIDVDATTVEENIDDISSGNEACDNDSDPLNIDQPLNNDDSSKNSNSNQNEENSSVDSSLVVKKETLFKIKCIDIKKLLDPSVLPAEKINASVVEISDSDDEISSSNKENKTQKVNCKPTATVNTKTSSSRKKVIVLDDSESGDNLNVNKKNKTLKLSTTKEERSSLNRQAARKAAKNLVYVSSLSENSTSHSEGSDVDIRTNKHKRKLRKKPNSVNNEIAVLNAQKDKKFSWKAYIPLPRIPAKQLAANYKKTLMKKEVKRLTNMDSLKRSRRQASGSSSDSPKSTVKNKRKCTDKSKEKAGNDKEDASSSDTSMINESVNTTKELDTLSENFNPDPGKDKAEIEEMILDGINSDEDSSNSDSGSKGDKEDDENNTKTKEKKSKAKEKTAAEKEKKKSESETEAQGNSKSKSDNEASGEDETDAEARKKTKKWRKDKLLTQNISSSDSDEDFAKFMKRKEKVEKASDSGDSEEKSSPKKKKRSGKRKSKHVLGSDSDSTYSAKTKSESSTDKSDSDKDKSSDEKPKKAARRRIKRLKDSSDEEDVDDRSTRKKIRNVWKKNSLAESTIAAEKEEQERKARIAEKQKKYNLIFEPDLLEKATVDKVVLDFDDETNKEVLKVNKKLVKHLKPHQAIGIQFMWNACYESLQRAKKTKGSGCILAHCMGLGKTLQVISLIHTLLLNEEATGTRKVLVVCPLSTVLNWVAEFKKWLPEDDDDETVVEVFELVSFKSNTERMYQVKEWDRCGGTLIMGYDMFRNLTNSTNKRMNKKLRDTFQKCLVEPGPDLVICDEGHLLKNEKSIISIAMNRLQSMRRIVLTGTPLQNNLREYFCMVQFVKPNLLGTYKEYLNRFVNPITNGQYTDSTPHDIQIMRKRSHVLHKLLDGIVQRKDYSVLAPFLPPKYEYVLFVSLTELQIKLYDHYKKFKSGRQSEDSGKGKGFLFVDFNEFQRICTHPRVLLDKSNEVKKKRDRDDILDDESEGSLRDFIDDDEEDAKSTSSDGSDPESGVSDGSKKKIKKEPPKQRLTRANAAIYEISDKETSDVEEVRDPSEWFKEYCTDDDLDNIAHSGKLALLFEILRQCEVIGDKVLVFSQSLYSLNVIEYFLGKIDDATQCSETKSFCGFSGSWAIGLDYFRLDGSSSCDNRAAWCKTFNNTDNTRARLFLISTRAGGLGINLVAANRVIIFDVSWNPSHDTQSIYRVYRFGQNKPSYIYRFVTLGTMEMKIYERQVTKQAISKRVIDEQQIDRHYNQSDLAELYMFEPVPDEERCIPLVPKDVLLGELLQMDKKIYKYHEHHSLLENKVDEVLDEEERKAAWEEFENEKKARSYSGSINNIPVQTIIIAIQSILRRENPAASNIDITTKTSEMFDLLQEQIATGTSPIFEHVFREVRALQAAEQQNRENYFRMLREQQAIMQQVQQFRHILNAQGTPYYNNPMANRQPTMPNNQNYPRQRAPSAAAFAQASSGNPVDYIDLND